MVVVGVGEGRRGEDFTCEWGKVCVCVRGGFSHVNVGGRGKGTFSRWGGVCWTPLSPHVCLSSVLLGVGTPPNPPPPLVFFTFPFPSPQVCVSSVLLGVGTAMLAALTFKGLGMGRHAELPLVEVVMFWCFS